MSGDHYVSELTNHPGEEGKAKILANRMIRQRNVELLDQIEKLRALLVESWALTGAVQSNSALRAFHEKVDAQANELGLRLPR